MTSAAASAPFIPFSGPFAIGTFSAAGETRFPGLMAPDGRALDLHTALDEHLRPDVDRGVFVAPPV
ncbi:hypothetical protein ACFWJ5_42280 [Streptomyces qaidamensis]|uniref:hypothetical protein n=1 Tax=Streptomyces qaidamensis TaxID=1783515 RepID=UPI0036598DDB